MTVLGVFEAIRPDDEAVSRKVGPVRPGDCAVPLLATTDSSRAAKVKVNVAEMIHADAERSRERALRRVDSLRTSTTVAALAQTHASLGEEEAALAAAREAIDLSLCTTEDGGVTWLDPSSARIAAEILLRFGHADDAYEALGRAPMTESLCVTYASIAAVLDKRAEAEKALAPYDNRMVAALRGYLSACSGDYRQAVHYLRQAVAEEPNDVDSLLNLAVSLWNLGAARKAIRTALRATRSAPGRKDISVLYLELLLASKDLDGLKREIAALQARKVIPDAKFLEIQARTSILREDRAKAVALLTAAVEAAKRENDVSIEGTTRSNLVRLQCAIGRISRDEASQQLAALVSQFPGNDAVVVNYAEMAQRRHEAPVLRKALESLEKGTTAIRDAYLRHQIAVLEGDNAGAGKAAEEWFDLEPNNPMAAVAALMSIGIGQERWSEAMVVAEHAIERFPHNQSVINHSAYVLAMGGHALEAIQLLEPVVSDDDFVMTATLGLAHLANGDIDQGMRLYREAANAAEKIKPAWRSLMTVFQGLIVRQLGLDKALPAEVIDALALIPFDLPEDWRDQSDFLRLHNVCVKNGYDWPPTL